MGKQEANAHSSQKVSYNLKRIKEYTWEKVKTRYKLFKIQRLVETITY